ncbi:MAG: hypothetical protein WDM70_04520 [Nitrosomonadales bacterium]
MQHNGVLTQAVIYDPTKNDLFTATRGRGAYPQRPPSAGEQAQGTCRLPDRHPAFLIPNSIISMPT